MSLPQIAQLEFDTIPEETSQPRGKSFLFDFKTGQFVLQNGKMVEATGLDALRIWVEKTLRTTINRYPVYEGTEYGSSIDDLIGSNLPLDFVKEEMKREVSESLLLNEEITGISNLEFVRDGSRVTISFTVDSVYGNSQLEVNF